MESSRKKPRSGFKRPYSAVYSVAITCDNKFIVSGSLDSTIRVWNLQERCQEAVLEGHTNSVNSVAITNDTKFIVSGSRDKLCECGISKTNAKKLF